jgi:hypothetical protein
MLGNNEIIRVGVTHGDQDIFLGTHHGCPRLLYHPSPAVTVVVTVALLVVASRSDSAPVIMRVLVRVMDVHVELQRAVTVMLTGVAPRGRALTVQVTWARRVRRSDVSGSTLPQPGKGLFETKVTSWGVSRVRVPVSLTPVAVEGPLLVTVIS